MEDIRGVMINSLIIKQLEDRGWIEVIGHREAAGRPALFATTRQFLDDLGIESLDQLPAIASSAGEARVMASLEASADPVQPGLLVEVPAQVDADAFQDAVHAGQPTPEGTHDEPESD